MAWNLFHCVSKHTDVPVFFHNHVHVNIWVVICRPNDFDICHLPFISLSCTKYRKHSTCQGSTADTQRGFTMLTGFRLQACESSIPPCWCQNWERKSPNLWCQRKAGTEMLMDSPFSEGKGVTQTTPQRWEGSLASPCVPRPGVYSMTMSHKPSWRQTPNSHFPFPDVWLVPSQKMKENQLSQEKLKVRW